MCGRRRSLRNCEGRGSGLCIRARGCAGAALTATHGTVGQFTPFDLIVVLLLSEGVSAGLTGGDDSVGGGLLVATTLTGLNFLVALMTARSRRLEVLFEGAPILIGRDNS